MLGSDFLQKYISLNVNSDFRRVYHRGKSCAKPALVVYSMKNRVGICRVGITVSKKIGNAVERNRSRRIIRAAFQSVMSRYELEGTYDFVLVARTKTKFLKTGDVEKALTECLKQVGVL